MRVVALCAILVVPLVLAGCSGVESPPPDEPAEGLILLSDAFNDGGEIPTRFANTGVDGGENISIPYAWSGAPDGTRSFLLLLVDRSEVANDWVHWIVMDIPVSTTSLTEGVSAAGIPGGIELTNTNGIAGYSGPQPPPGSGDHPYEATLYALDADSLDVQDGASLDEIVAAAEAVSIAEVSLTGYLGR